VEKSLLRCFTSYREGKGEYKSVISFLAGEGACLISLLVMQQQDHQMKTGTMGFKAKRLQSHWNFSTQTAMDIKSSLMAGKRS